jgi:hypothetical protein
MGGISILLNGYPGQLLPVAGSTLYDDRLDQDLAQTGYRAIYLIGIIKETICPEIMTPD